MPRVKQHKKGKLPTGKARPAKRALPLSEAGLEKLARQINDMVSSTHAMSLLSDMDLQTYIRLATVLVRLVEAGVKVEKHHADEKRKQDAGKMPGVSTQSLEEIEQQLHLL